jgi:peptidoglycan pentaglycine glycine transferase (the first glycine)
MAVQPPAEWDSFLERFPDAHLLQTTAWGELKTGFGWHAERVAVAGGGAQVLFRRLAGPFTLAYIPKGPLGTNWADLWPEVDALCRRRRAVFLKVEPDLWQPFSDQEMQRLLPGFIPSPQSIQPRRTLLVDLSGSEDEVLARMKQKTRYNIHLAEKKGIQVRPWEDLDAFQALMETTGRRDGFGVHSLGYYRRAYRLFSACGACELLAAEYDGQPVAALMVFARGSRAWYFYGASSDAERNRMPTYLLQWEAMRWARAKGCRVYDLWGVPDEDQVTLEEQFQTRSGGLWGVYRFKRGFGGVLQRSVSAWDRVYQPVLYRLYRWVIARRAAAVPA